MKKKILPAISRIITISCIISLLSALFLNLSTLRAIGDLKNGNIVQRGYFCAIVSTGSMEPVISAHDLLIVKGAVSYEQGDIVTYMTPQDSLVTHRVRQVLEDGYITQGDANNVPDGKLSPDRVMGKVLYILPRAGGIINALRMPLAMILLISMSLLWWLIQRIRGKENEEGDDEKAIKHMAPDG